MKIIVVPERKQYPH